MAHTSMYSKIIKTAGIVKQAQTWETKAIPEATRVSLPNALGMIIVLNPKGIEREQMAQAAKVYGKGITAAMPRKSRGNTISRNAVTKYTLLILSTSFRLNCAMVIPVSSIATGDMQPLAAEIAFAANFGTGIPTRPMTMPKIVQINMGLTKFFSRLDSVCFFEVSAISRTGTPQR